jgi:hypothetical protein
MTNAMTFQGTPRPLKRPKIGNSVRIILPKKALAHLKPPKGASVFLTECAQGFHLMPYNPASRARIRGPMRVRGCVRRPSRRSDVRPAKIKNAIS